MSASDAPGRAVPVRGARRAVRIALLGLLVVVTVFLVVIGWIGAR